MFKNIAKCTAISAAGFTVGFSSFLKPWHVDESSMQTLKRPLETQRQDIIEKLQSTKVYMNLIDTHEIKKQSERIPIPHRPNHVGQGLLYGPGHLEIDPIVCQDLSNKKLTVFYHLGNNLANEKKTVHKGILTLLLDEALCYCGFPTLPSKRGVTARLNVKFFRDIPIDSTVILNANVVESKGRKCIIKGTLESLSESNGMWWSSNNKPIIYATAECILVEPKWFKYISWVNVF